MRATILTLVCIIFFGSAAAMPILPPPSATIAISSSAAVCQGSAGPVITFTGSGGTAPYTFTYQINGVGSLSITTISGNSVTVPGTTTASGTKTYTLISVDDAASPVQNVSGTVSYTVSSPPAVNFTFNNNNSCSGTSIQFSSSVTGTGPFTYAWDFGDGATSTSANPTHSFTSLGCGTISFTVTLTVSTAAGCIVTKSQSISVTQKPNIDFTDVLNPFGEPFNNCQNAAASPIYSITVGNISTSSCITSYSINWGIGPTVNNISFPISYTYNARGVYDMVITAYGSNGCVNTKTYTIKNISNPLGGINSPGSTQNLCAPTANLQFAISNWGTNSLDTNYVVNYGDGTPIESYTQAQMNASSYYNSADPSASTNFPIPHVYTTSSCPAASFQVTLDVTNACGTTPFTLGNISILTKPQAEFTNPISACINTSVTFTNTTVAGYGQGCVQTAIYSWNFGDGSPIVTTPVGPSQNTTHTYTTPGTYTVTLTAQNYCGTTTRSHTICIEPPLTAQFALSSTSGCAPMSVTATNTTNVAAMCEPPSTLWSVAHVPAYCGSATAAIPNQASTNANFNFVEAGTYTITLSTTNSCGTTQSSQTVTVTRPPTVSITAIDDFCGPGTISPQATVNACAPMSSPITYAWSFPGGLPATSNLANPGTVTYSAAGTYTVSLIVTNSCGSTSATAETFTIKELPVTTNTDLTQFICSGTTSTAINLTSNLSGTTFTWTGVQSSGVSGAVLSGSSNVIPAQLLTYTGSATGTVTYTVTPTSNGCVGSAVTIIISIAPAPAITAQPQSQTLCLNGTASPLQINVNAGASTPTYQWYSNTMNSSSGGTIIPGATSSTYTPITTLTGTTYYYVVISLSSAGCTALNSQVAAITVEPLPEISLQPLPFQQICVGGTIASPLSVATSGGTGTVSYQWFSNSVNSTTGGTAISGATTSSYSPATFASAGSYYYYVAATYSGSGCGTITSQVAQVDVVPDPIIALQPLTAQTLCQNASPIALEVNASGGAGAFSFQWFSNSTNSNTGGNLISGATSSTYSPLTSTVGTVYYYCIVTQPSTSGCSVNSATAAIIVNQSPTIVTQPQPSEVCVGGNVPALSFTTSNGVGTPTYQWYSNAVSNTTSGIAIPGETNATFSPPSNTAGTTYYYATVSFSGITGSCATISTAATAVAVVLPAIIDLQPTASHIICVGGALSQSLTVSYSGGSGAPTYQWYQNTSATTTGGTLVGSNSPNFNPPVFNSIGTFFYYVIVTLSGSGCSVVASDVVTIEVLPDPVITQQPIPTQTLCQGATPSLLEVLATGGAGTSSYQWYSSLTASTSGGTAILGATATSFSPFTNVIGSQFYYVVISQLTSGCSVTSNVAEIVVNSSPSVTVQPASSEVCVGGNPSALTFVTANGAGTATYQWFVSSIQNNSGGTAISGATAATLLPDADAIGTLYYYAEITFSGISGTCSTIETDAIPVTVTPAAQISLQPVTAHTVCAGGSLSEALTVAYTGGSGSATYQWYQNTVPTTSGGTPVGTNSPTFLPAIFDIAGNFYYYVTVTLSSSGCGAIASELVTVTVLPDPVVNQQPIELQTLCEGAQAEAVFVDVTGGSGAFEYQWYSNSSNSNNNGNPIIEANTSSFTPPNLGQGTFYYYCVITQPSTSGCSVVSNVSTVVVNQSPSVVSQPESSEVCEGGNVTSLSFSTVNGIGTETYQWFSNTINDTSSGVLIDGATAATFDPPSTVAGTTYFYAEIIFSGITGSCATISTQAAEIIIAPGAAVTVQPESSQIVCVGGTLSEALFVSFAGGTGAASYEWFSNTAASNIGGTSLGVFTETYLPPAFTSSGTNYYYVVISFGASGCLPVVSQVATVIVVEDPTIIAQPLHTQTVCSGEIATELEVIASGGIGTDYEYQWYVSMTSAPGSGVAISGATSPYHSPDTSLTGTKYYYVEINQPGDLGCNTTSIAAEVIVSPAPQITIQPQSQSICSGQSLSSLSFTVQNGVGAPQIQWYSNTSATNVGGNVILGATSLTYMPDNVVVGTLYYYATISYPEIMGSCASISTEAVPIHIQQNPIISNFSETICSSAAFDISPISEDSDIVPAGTTYTWGDPVISPPGAVTGAAAQNVSQTEISQTLINITVLPATVTYLVTPVSGVCERASFTITVIVNPAINPNIILTDNLCFGADDASITTNVTGGIPFLTGNPYVYNWSGPDGFSSTNSSINNLAPGQYLVTISDAGGCPFSQTYTISEPTELVFGNTSKSNVSCNGLADGVISIEVNGATPNYNFNWTKNGNSFSTDQNLINLAPGLYEVTVTDSNNCGFITQSFTVTEPMPLIATVALQTNVECFGDNTGAIVVAVDGGTQIELSSGIFDYQYTWTGPNGFTSSTRDISNLLAGDYQLLVTDANNCQYTLPVTITSSPEIIIAYTTTEITCYGANDANMSVTLSGGVAPYNFTWSNLSTALNQPNMSAGSYTIVVTDALGCVASTTIIIPEAPLFDVTPVVTQISCYGANDGSIALNLVGGIAPLNLVWSDGSTAGVTRNALSPGTYTATITDGKPCLIVRTFVIVEPSPLMLSAQIIEADDCNVSNGGAIDLLVAGGTPPYNYLWSNGSTLEDVSGLTNGDYSVTVVDARGCSAVGQYSILRPEPMAIVINTEVDFSCETHDVSKIFTAAVSGGMPPYQLQWSSGSVSGINNQVMQTNVSGMVTISAVDALGCVVNHSLQVEIPVLGYSGFDAESFGNETYGIFSVQDPIVFLSTITGDYENIFWDFGDGSFSNDLNPVHTYVNAGSYVITQTVRFAFGCEYTKIITLVIEEGYFLTIPNAFTPNDDNLNDNYRPVSERLQSLKLEIYDSWGSMIYSETGDVLVGWNGEIKNVPAENGNYYCTVTAKTFYGKIINESRTFVLIK